MVKTEPRSPLLKGFVQNYICKKCNEASHDYKQFVSCMLCMFVFHKSCIGSHVRKIHGLTIEHLHKFLKIAWREDTCYPPSSKDWTPENPSLGQCGVTTLIVQDCFGGEILFCRHLNHYWNLLPDGTEVDLTKDQFRERALQICKDDKSLRDFLLYGEAALKAKTSKRYFILRERLCRLLKNQQK